MGDLTPGSQFAGCAIEDVAGRGGMGVVYRAHELALGRPVALKLIAAEHMADEEFRERFAREVRLTASIDHPNVIPVYAAGEEDERPYLVMRYVDGTDLQALLRRDGGLPPARAAQVVAAVAAALDAAHRAGLVHRDVKPANVLLDAGGHVYLTDFGLTRLAGSDARITDTGRWMGTVDFSSPEQLRAERTDARSDVYALGCVLYATLTGEPPFRRGTVPASMQAHLNEPPPTVSERGLPKAFDAVLARALAKDPGDRFPSAGDLGRAAVAAARDERPTTQERSVARGEAAPAATVRMDGAPPVVEPTVALPTRTHSSRRRRRMKIVLACLAALPAVAVSTVVLAAAGRDHPPPAVSPVGAGDARAALARFAAAYGSEDVAALDKLLTADVVRVLPAEVEHGRDAVVARYRRQFSDNDVRAFELSGVTATGGPAGRAEADYTVRRRGAGSFSGHIVLGVVRERGQVRVRLIAATPD